MQYITPAAANEGGGLVPFRGLTPGDQPRGDGNGDHDDAGGRMEDTYRHLASGNES